MQKWEKIQYFLKKKTKKNKKNKGFTLSYGDKFFFQHKVMMIFLFLPPKGVVCTY